ncbi:MAG: hypothetical protein KBD64_03275 [Gammaproteobacteria bacterium]|nr:hypothetical protein [Gammaproteobacteria bacterium]
MSGLYELLVLLLPLILSGGVLTALVSRLIPVIINKLEKNQIHSKISKFYKNYNTAPEVFANVQPKLKKYFDKTGWDNCQCLNCVYLRDKVIPKYLQKVKSRDSSAAAG